MGIVTDWSRICNFVINKVNIKLTLRRAELRVSSNLSRVTTPVIRCTSTRADFKERLQSDN